MTRISPNTGPAPAAAAPASPLAQASSTPDPSAAHPTDNSDIPLSEALEIIRNSSSTEEWCSAIARCHLLFWPIVLTIVLATILVPIIFEQLIYLFASFFTNVLSPTASTWWFITIVWAGLQMWQCWAFIGLLLLVYIAVQLSIQNLHASTQGEGDLESGSS